MMGVTRLLSLALTILMVPALIHGLGSKGFASWAILLGASALFGQIEGGMPTAFVRSVGVVADGEAPRDRVFWASLACVASIYLIVAPGVAATAGAITDWVRLETVQIPASRLLLLVYAAVALRALLQYGTHALVAAQAFPQAATISFLQSFLSNLAAAGAAVVTRRVEVCVFAFWATQLAVLATGCASAARTLGLRRPRRLDVALVRPLLAYAVQVQFSDLAQTVNFQFGKFVIAAFVGSHAVSVYEVANRAVVALRSVASSATEALLPRATRDFATSENLRATYRQLNAVAALGLVFLCFVPMAIAPLMMYAWVGEMGYVSRAVFVILAAGMAANLLALPAVVLSQASGRPQLQAMAAASSIVMNVALTFELVRAYRLRGAAAGTALALTLSAVILIYAVHRALGWSLRRTLGEIGSPLWLPATVCLVIGIGVERGFASFLRPLGIPARYVLAVRAEIAILAVCAYLACVVLIAAGERVRRRRVPSLAALFEGAPAAAPPA
jgi:O-antigen/teichoic acid export membrane protein